MSDAFLGRLALIQRVFPEYRAPFFNLLGQACTGGLFLAYGMPRDEESIQTTQQVADVRLFKTKNVHLFNGRYYLCYQRGLLGWLKSIQPDALIIEANPRYLSSAAAVHWIHRQGKPVIGWGLGAPNPALGSRGIRNAFLQQFDSMLAYSQKGAEEYAAAGINPQSIFVANNAVAPKPKYDLIKRPAYFTGAPVVLFVGRLQQRKRVDLLINACADLPESLQPSLWIVGDGPARTSLETQAEHVYPKTQFLGARYNKDLEDLFVKADLFVLPGTGGLAVQQAMSFSLPVIVGTGDGTQADLVREGNGWQYDEHNHQNLSGILRDALADVKRLRKMGVESYRIVSEEINLEKMVRVFLQAIEFSCQQTRVNI